MSQHLFQHKSNGWTYKATKTDGTASVDDYGYALALSNDALAIGMSHRNSYGGVDLYDLDDSFGHLGLGQRHNFPQLLRI